MGVKNRSIEQREPAGKIQKTTVTAKLFYFPVVLCKD
jgi:hypothetical protein